MKFLKYMRQKSVLLSILQQSIMHMDLKRLLRGFIADYGVPMMVVVWTAISYLPAGSVPKGIPRRPFCPNPWSPGANENWTVIKVFTWLGTVLGRSYRFSKKKKPL
ncbi:hypothetical protein ACB094_09G030900 [Castanea mollissima]